MLTETQVDLIREMNHEKKSPPEHTKKLGKDDELAMNELNEFAAKKVTVATAEAVEYKRLLDAANATIAKWSNI